MVRPGVGRALAGAVRPRQADQPQCPLSAGPARRGAGRARPPASGQARPRAGCQGRPPAGDGDGGPQAAGTDPGRSRPVGGVLRPPAADPGRRQGRPHAGRVGPGRPCRAGQAAGRGRRLARRGAGERLPRPGRRAGHRLRQTGTAIASGIDRHHRVTRHLRDHARARPHRGPGQDRGRGVWTQRAGSAWRLREWERVPTV